MRLALALAIGILAANARGACALTLVKNGRPTAAIVLSSEPSAQERQCAAELQKYVRLMSGATLPVTSKAPLQAGAVLIGRQKNRLAIAGTSLSSQSLGYDGVILKTSGNKLVVLGSGGRGQLYAAYELLKRLGCRFYLPHADGEVVPKKATITVPDLNYVHKPSVAHRVFWNNSYVWNGLAHKDWYSSWEPKVYQGGIDISHGHNYEYMVPSGRYFATHPEYFALVSVDGQMKRVPDGQFCLSNPDVVRICAEYCIRVFDETPGRVAQSLSPNDNWGWCQCDKCKAMDSPDPKIGLSQRVLTFNNRVAEIVAKKYPDRWLAYYAEYSTMPAPPVGMRAHPMILPVIVDRYDMMHSVHDPYMGDTSKTGIHYNPDYIRVFDQWGKIAKQLMVYEWLQVGKDPMLPCPMLYPIGERVRFYRDRGVVGYSGEVIGRSPVNDITMYVAAQMLWDADQDPDKIIDEFFDLYFAQAAKPMREYYRMLHETSFYSQKRRGAWVPPSVWTSDLIARLYAKLGQAQKLAATGAVKRRLDREFKSLKATDLCSRAYALAEKWTDKHDGQARDESRALTDEAIAYLRSIADEDIVSDVKMIECLRELRERLDK